MPIAVRRPADVKRKILSRVGPSDGSLALTQAISNGPANQTRRLALGPDHYETELEQRYDYRRIGKTHCWST